MKARRHLHDLFDTELCLVGASSDAALADAVRLVLQVLENHPDAALADVAFTLARASRGAPAVLAIVASSVADLRERLRIALAKLQAGAARIRDKSGMFYFRQRLRRERGLVFLFPGETSLYPEMLRDLCLSFDCCRDAFNEADAACQDAADGFRPSEWLFAGPAARGDASPEPASGMAGAILCTHAANTALARLFESLDIRPDALLGHSGGEFMALEYAGAFGPLAGPERIRFLREGYLLCTGLANRPDLPQSLLLTLEDAAPDILSHLPASLAGRLSPVMLNGPRQTVVAVPCDGLDEAVDHFRRLGARVSRAGLRRFYHTPAFTPGIDAIRAFLRRWLRQPPRLPVYSCDRADPLPTDAPAMLEACTRQWNRPVRFGETIAKLHADGFRIFVELGARGNLSTLVSDVLDGQPHVAVATNRIHRSGLTQLHHALAQLAAQGVALDAGALHMHRPSRLLDAHPSSARPPSRPDPQVQLDTALPSMRAPSGLAPLVEGAPSPDEAAPARAGAPRGPASGRGMDFPLLTGAEVVHEKPGDSIELLQNLSLDAFPLIRDYALSAHGVSMSQPALGGLPMLSATLCLEIMAEAARRLAPRKHVVQVEDMRGKRAITLEKGETRVLVLARRTEWPDPGTTAVRVVLRAASAGSTFTPPMAEATVLLAAALPEREVVRPAPLRAAAPLNWSAADIYPDRLSRGRLLQTVNHVLQGGEDGIDYELTVPPRQGTVKGAHLPQFSVCPQVLEGVGSGIGLWLSRDPCHGMMTLPFRCRSARFLTSVLPEGARLRAYLRVTAVNPHSYVADVLVSDGRGRLVLSVCGWEELICPITPAIHRLIHRPCDACLTQELPGDCLGEHSAAVAGRLALSVPAAVFESQQELWLRATAFALLNASERDEWLSMRGASSRRVEWLLGRACVKETIRRHLLAHCQQAWSSADIAIWSDDSGKPHAHGPWRERMRDRLDISIAHTTTLVAAAIALNARIGIDLERIGRDLSDDFSRSVFSPEENELAASSGDGPTALLRFWCAKEALAKALGTGIRYNPGDLRVRRHDAQTGNLELELAGQWLDAFKNLRGHALPVHTSTVDGHILATCVIPPALLPPP